MSEENVDVILKAVEAVNRRDADAFVARVSPDVEWETNPTMVGLGGIYHGRAGTREFFEELFGLETLGGIPGGNDDALNLGPNAVVATATLQGVLQLLPRHRRETALVMQFLFENKKKVLIHRPHVPAHSPTDRARVGAPEHLALVRRDTFGTKSRSDKFSGKGKPRVSRAFLN